MKANTFLPNLTPLRGIAALLTVIFHVDLMVGMGGNVLLKFEDSLLISKLYLMVDFFFVLSGFIMLHVYGRLFADGVTGGRFRQFTVARFARVYPLHLAMLLLTVCIWKSATAAGVPQLPVLQTENTLYSFVTNLFLLQSMNFHQWFSWVHASWSISTEWWMYMLFPFLVVPFNKLNTIGRLVVVAVCMAGYVAIMYWVVPLVTVPDSLAFFRDAPVEHVINVSYQFGILRCMFGFVLGMVVYQTYSEAQGKRLFGHGYILVLLVLGLLVCLHVAAPDVVTVAFFPLILLSAAYGSPRMDRFFAWKPLQKLGDWSFSIYLTHQPLMYAIWSINTFQLVKKGATGPPPIPSTPVAWGICVVFIALTLLVSALTYRYLEVPMRRRINQGVRA